MTYSGIERLTLILLHKANSKISGRTMFQKIMYILKSRYEDRVPELKSLQFKLYYYGPFSREFENVLAHLTSLGLLSREREQVIDFVRYNYSLHERGEQIARQFYDSLSGKRRNLIEDIEEMANEMRKLNRKSLQTVISEAYKIAERKGL